MSTLKITLLQQPLVWRDGLANLAAFDALLAPIVGRDLIVLPEMFTTGFAMDAGESALPEQQVIDWLHGWAVKSHALIGGSVALKTDEGAVNRFLLVEPGGQVHAYDKRHLFRMAGEHLHYRAGNRRRAVTIGKRCWRRGRLKTRCMWRAATGWATIPTA